MKIYNKMIKIIPVILLTLSIIIPMALSNDENNTISNLSIEVNQISDETLELKIIFPDFTFDSVTMNNERYANIKLESEPFSLEIGQAKLPVIRRMIEVPFNSDPEIIVTDIDWKITFLDSLNLPEKIAPVQPSIIKIPGAYENAEFIIDNDYYSINQFMPIENTNIMKQGTIRERNFIILEINPVKYNPVSGEIQTMNSCNILINMIGGDIETTNNNIARFSSSSYEELFDTMFINYGYYGSGLLRDKFDSEGYLIIVHDAFFEEITPLANWKDTYGYEVTVTKTSEIPNGITAPYIKDYIEDAYDTWVPPPSYILLVGDTTQIPAFTGSASGGETDTEFVTMDEDIFPDIYIGRFPADTESQVEIMVNKTIYYEQGNFPSNDWIKKAAFIASDDASLTAEYTHNYVIDTHLEPNGYTCDKIYERLGGDTQDIFDSLNDGRSLCIYSGHGGPSGWGCVPFDITDIYNLNNNGMYPFVCSHACSTSTYEGTSECMSEAWLRAPNKGGIAMWGSSISTLWPEDDAIERRVFDAWWNLSLDRIGQMTDKGMYDSYMQFGPSIEDFMESYNVMGDASVKIWSDDPGPSEDHDMIVFDLDVPSIVGYGETINVEATILNFGYVNESNILVNFTVNGTVLDSTIIDVLNSTNSTIVSFVWNPDVGTYNVSVEIQPVSGENNTDNNVRYEIVQIIYAPDIWINPFDFNVNLNADIISVETLTIGNSDQALAELIYNITYSGDGADWLSASPTDGTIAIDSSTNIDVTINTAGLTEGDYQAIIVISSNDLHNPVINVPVNLSVVYATDVGAASVNYPTGIQPVGDYKVNATVENFGSDDQYGVLVNCTIYESLLSILEDFEIDNGGYTSGGTALWEWGSPSNGPGTAYSGSNCWGTNLDGDYFDDDDATLDSTVIDLNYFVAPELSFWHWYNTENYYDGGNVKISTDGGITWTLLGSFNDPYPEDAASTANAGIPGEPCFSNSNGAWEKVTFDLSSYINEQVIIRWHFGSDGSAIRSGWFIDDIEVYSSVFGPGDIIYTSEATVDIDAYTQEYVEFTPYWTADLPDFYVVKVKTMLPGDQDHSNNATLSSVSLFEDLPPTISGIKDLPDPQTVGRGGFVNISCNGLDDFTGIHSVFVDITGPGGFTPVNASMTQLDADTFYYNAAYTYVGYYSYFIWANDTVGHSVTSSSRSFRIMPDEDVTVDIELKTGWNLITIPIVNDWMASTLAENITGCQMIGWFDSTTQELKTHVVAAPVYDFPIANGMGYFVLVNTDSTFSLTGAMLTDGVSVDIGVGWNMIGWFPYRTTSASSYAENMSGCQMVAWFDATTQELKTHVVAAPAYDFNVDCGMGLFILTDTISSWYGEG